MSGGARDLPLTYEGAYDATKTYLPRQIAVSGGLPYMALAKTTGVDPATHPTSWLLLGGGGITLWVGPSAPTDGSVFWYDTDATC